MINREKYPDHLKKELFRGSCDHIAADIIVGDRGEKRHQQATQHRECLQAVRNILEGFLPETVYYLTDKIGGKDTVRKVFIRRQNGRDNILDDQGRLFIESTDGVYKHSMGAISFAQRTGLITFEEGKVETDQETIDYYKWLNQRTNLQESCLLVNKYVNATATASEA